MSFVYDIAATPWRDVMPKGIHIHLHMYACVRVYTYLSRAPLRLPQPLPDQILVRVCSCPLCIINCLCILSYQVQLVMSFVYAIAATPWRDVMP